MFCSILILFLAILGGFLWNQMQNSSNPSYYVDDTFFVSYNPEYDSKTKFDKYKRHIEEFRRDGVWQIPIQKQIKIKEPVEILPELEDKFTKKQIQNQHIITIGKARFTFLTSKIIRIEWEENKKFINQNSLVFSEREDFLIKNKDFPPSIEILRKKDQKEVLFV